MEGVGVDLSEVSLRFVKITGNGKKGFDVLNFGEYKIPDGVISLGQIEKPEVLRDILIRFKNEHDIQFVHASLPESIAYLSEMEIPRTKDGDLYESIELQLEEHVPINLDDAAFDYEIIDTGNKRSDVIKMMVSATQKKNVQAYQDIFSSAGITLLSLETDATALLRVVIPKGSQETTLILDMGRTKTGVYIVSKGIVSFVSDIEIGGKDIIAAIMKDSVLTIEEVKEMYKKLEQNEKPEDKRNYEIVLRVFSDIKEEVNKHFIFWNTYKDKNGQKKDKIEKIILCGSGATIFGLQEYLSSELKIPVEIANVWGNLFSFDDTIPEISFHDSLLYSTAIGLSLYTHWE